MHQSIGLFRGSLEVPGAGKKGPDKENVDRLKAVRAELDIA